MDTAFVLLGGLGLFLYGMETMSRSLQQTAGNKLKGFLRTLTANRFLGVLCGTIATSIVQSSSVTTVMVVSFVNAGLMALPQAISVIMGAHIGTTITAQIIAFRIQDFALPIIALGAFVSLFIKSERIKYIGEGIFGFGIIFLGLHLMTTAFDPLRGSAPFQNILSQLAQHPWQGLLVGLIITILVQSSSVTTGVTIALALSSLITFEQAVPLILGENIGTTITANFAAIGGSRTAKQAARAHFIINALGALLALAALKPFMNLVRALSPDDIARQIANAHTIFNVLTTMLFLPFIKGIAHLTEFLVLRKKGEQEELYYLEKNSLTHPDTALDEVKRALIEMNTLAAMFIKLIMEALISGSEKNMARATQLSQKIERYQIKITTYLEKITAKNLSREQSKNVPRLVRIIHEIERMRDYGEKMKAVSTHLQSEGRKFRPVEREEIKGFFVGLSKLLTRTNAVIENGNKAVSQEIMGGYDLLNAQKEHLREKSRQRYTTHRTGIAIANYYYDVVSSLEEIAKKCRNIAFVMIE